MSFLAQVFPKFLTPQELVSYMSERRYFGIRFGKQRFSGFETLLKSALHHYYWMFPSIWDKLSWKNCFLVRSEILGLFVNILTAEYKVSRRNIKNFQKQLQTQLSQKRKAFSWFFKAFFKCTSSLKHFEQKDGASSLSFPEIFDSTGSGYLNV